MSIKHLLFENDTCITNECTRYIIVPGFGRFQIRVTLSLRTDANGKNSHLRK